VTKGVEPVQAEVPLDDLLDERALDIPDRLLDLLPVGIYFCDRDGLVLRYNRAAAELWGCSPKIGDPAIRYCGSHRLYSVDGDYVPHAKCPMADVLATGQGLRDGEIVVERPDGTRILALVNIEAIKDSSGQLIGAVSVFRDKSEKRSAEPEPRGGWRSSIEILQSLPTAVYTTDAAGRITFYNEAAAELWGMHPELGASEFCGSWKLYWPDGTPLPHDECPMALALKERRAIKGMEAIAERPDGTRVPFMAYPMPLFDDAGTFVGGVNALVDVTERHEAEQQIRRSEARYRDIAAIVEFSNDAVLAMDLDGVITSWNKGAERLFGYTATEVIGRSVLIIVPADRHGEEPAILARIRSGERIDSYETIRRHKDGSLVDISLTVSPVRDSQGAIVGASKIARDIGERRRAEERQHLLLRELDHRVRNLFTLTGGLVALSARSAKTPEDLASAVRGRLAALAQAHSLTLRKPAENGHRAEPSTTLHTLIETILSPYDGRTDDERPRVSVSGPDTPIAGQSVTSFALLLYEFATNAAKHGALSTPDGTIDIVCSQDGGRFVLTWTEHGGLRIDDHPDTEGFGTILTRATVEGQLRGEISYDWNPPDLTIRLSVARDRLAAE
jgi:PAS domain S-box-containing protein